MSRTSAFSTESAATVVVSIVAATFLEPCIPFGVEHVVVDEKDVSARVAEVAGADRCHDERMRIAGGTNLLFFVCVNTVVCIESGRLGFSFF